MHKKGRTPGEPPRPNISLSRVFLGKQKQTLHVKRNKATNI